jgi:hypothetical protein
MATLIRRMRFWILRVYNRAVFRPSCKVVTYRAGAALEAGQAVVIGMDGRAYPAPVEAPPSPARKPAGMAMRAAAPSQEVRVMVRLGASRERA